MNAYPLNTWKRLVFDHFDGESEAHSTVFVAKCSEISLDTPYCKTRAPKNVFLAILGQIAVVHQQNVDLVRPETCFGIVDLD